MTSSRSTWQQESSDATEARARMDTLPLLALEIVCEYLAVTDSKRLSLFAFSLVSKQCFAAAERERFERIVFLVENRQQAMRILSGWDNILSINDRLKYVRRVKFIGHMQLATDDAETDPNESFRAAQLAAVNDTPQRDFMNEEDSFSPPPVLKYFTGSEPKCSAGIKEEKQQSWLSIANFLAKLPGLRHVFWASTDQVPRCILDTMHTVQPKAKLHVQTFSLRSLYRQSDEEHSIDADEYALATSPSLSSLCVPIPQVDNYGNVEYNANAVLDMIDGAAPNLRTVTLWAQQRADYWKMAEVHRPPWQGLGNPKDGILRWGGSLESLSFRGPRYNLSAWLDRINTTNLRRLDLRWALGVNRSGLECLARATDRNAFQCLEVLLINFADGEGDGDPDSVVLWRIVLSSLPSLRRLGVGHRNPMTGAMPFEYHDPKQDLKVLAPHPISWRYLDSTE